MVGKSAKALFFCLMLIPASAFADVVLSWVAPSERQDNTIIKLSEIAGYKIYYGTEADFYPDSLYIEGADTESYTFTNLPPNEYFFVLTTIDNDGRESQFSIMVNVVEDGDSGTVMILLPMKNPRFTPE